MTLNDDTPKDFPHPLDTWIEEDIPVKRNKIDPDTGKVTTTTQLEKVKTKYMNVPPVKHRCQDGEHIFRVSDPNRGIFVCTICPYARQVFPTTYEFKDGKLIHRITGKII